MTNFRQAAYRALRKSESFFKTDMVYLARGGFWLTLLQVASSLMSFVAAIGFAHFISKDTYGTYKYILSAGALIGALSLTGLPTVVTNAVARGKDGTLSSAFKKNLAWSLPMLVVFFGVAVYYIARGNTTLGVGLLVLGLATPLLSSTSLADAFLIGKKDFRRSAVTSTLATFAVYAATLGTALAGGSALMLLVAFVVSSLVGEVLVYIYARRVYQVGTEVDPDAISYGAHLSVINIVVIAVDRLDSIFAFHFLGPAELAVYTFAVAIPEQIKGLVKNVSSLALPKFSEKAENGVPGLGHKMITMTLVMIPIIGLYLYFAPLIFRIFFPQYAGEAVFLSRVHVLSLITAAAILPVTYLQARAAKKELYYYNVVGGIFQIAAMAFGVIMYGLIGLVVAIGVSRVFRFLYAVILMQRFRPAVTQ